MNRSYLYAGLTILFWATIPSAFKIALKHVNFIELLFYAILTTVFILFFILLAQGRLRQLTHHTRTQYRNSVILGFLNPFFYYMILLKAYSVLPAQIAQPLNFTWPIVLVFLAGLILKQKVTAINYIALFLSFIGVYLISSEGTPFDLKFAEPLGVFLAVGSSLIWAMFWILNVKDERDEVTKIFLNFLFSLVFITPVYILFTEHTIPSFYGIAACFYVGAFEMGITFVLWLKALKTAPSTANVSNLIYLTPFFALIFINFILGEKIFLTTVIGLIFIVSGIILQEIHKKHKRKNVAV
ncbi:MAG: DMT family transporter [Bacteroidales bacterium]